MEELIIKKARDLFFSYGLKSVSMDDLARKSGTSKKTLYQSVADKNELVEKVVADLVREHTEAMTRCRVEAGNAVEEVLLKTRVPFITLASINWNFFYELEKFFPSVWEKMLTHRQQVMFPAVVQNLQKGIAEGVYRPDLVIPFVAHIRLQQVTTALNSKDFKGPSTDARRLMNSLTEFYLHAITTTKGKQLLIKYLKGYNEN